MYKEKKCNKCTTTGVFYNITDNLAIKDPFFRKFKPWAFQTREEQYEICLQKHLYINKKCKELDLTEPVDKFFYTEYATFPYFL